MAISLGRSRGPIAALAAAALLYAICLLLGEDLRSTRAAVPPVEDRLFVPSPRTARFISAGYNELAADLVWARTLVYYGDGMMNGFTMKDVEPMLALVNTLDPWFRRPYAWGAYATTFRQKEATQEEFKASVAILERGLAVYPDDWELAWILGLRYYMDLKTADPVEQRQFQEIGASYIERAMRLPGAPADLPVLAATLRTKLGQRDRALRELREMILTTEDGKARDKLMERYQRLSSESLAHALNDARERFDASWKRAMPYAPGALFVLVGPAPPYWSAQQLLEPPDLLEPDDLDASDAQAADDAASAPAVPPAPLPAPSPSP